MSAPTPNKLGLKDRMMAEVRLQPRRAAILGVLMVVLAAVTAYEVLRRTGPSRAEASAPAAGRSAPGRPAAAPGEGPAVGQAAAGPAQGDGLIVSRDLFTPNPVFFPPEARPRPAPTVTPVDDTAAKAEAERRTVQAQAAALRLQSTVVGQTPTAIVNGQVLRVGDWVSGFQVTGINSRSCTIERNGLRVVLEMDN